MGYYKKYQLIIADYNRGKDGTTVEETFARLLDLVNSPDTEQQRMAEEGLSEDELALFDLLYQAHINKTGCERLKQASRGGSQHCEHCLSPWRTGRRKSRRKQRSSCSFSIVFL